MQPTLELDSWSDFEKRMERHRLEETQEVMTGPLFFRGHSDATWRLETTLERYMGPYQKVDQYYRNISRILSEIETFTDRNWDLPSLEDHHNSWGWEYPDKLRDKSTTVVPNGR